MDDIRDAARLARECDVAQQAVLLARWVGEAGRQVTAGRVLRRPDVAAAGAALGVAVPAKVRTAADVPALHRPWCFGAETGLLRIGEGKAQAGPALAGWPPDDGELLAGWLAGLRAVCEAEADPRAREGMILVALAMLVTLDGGDRPAGEGVGLRRAVDAELIDVCEAHGKPYWQAWQSLRWRDDEEPLAGLLTEFGAINRKARRLGITPLGRWAVARMRADLPAAASPRLPAEDLLVRAATFEDAADRRLVMSEWVAERTVAGAAREILAVADRASASLRAVAVDAADSLGDDALPAWREMSGAPCAGPHARAVLASWGQGQDVSEAEWRWLAIDGAVAALADSGPDEAFSRVQESMPGADLEARLGAVRGTGHPDAGPLAEALAGFAASGAPRTADQVVQLKVALADFRPTIWRRVLLPGIATLGDLHHVIQVLYGWDGDHLHEFQIGERHYSDPMFPLEEAQDEEGLRLAAAFGPGVKKVLYVYDFGAYWRHEITLEKRADAEAGQAYPVCIAFNGDSPVEYWSEEDPSDPEPFSLIDVNRRLVGDGEPGEP